MKKINIYSYRADYMGWREVPGLGTFAPVGHGCFRKGWVRARLVGGEQHLEDDKILDGVGYGAVTPIKEEYWGVLYDDTLQPRQLKCCNGHIFVAEIVGRAVNDYCPTCKERGVFLHPVEGKEEEL